MFNRSIRSPKPKLIHKKKDAAPMLFFIDQIASPNFLNPVLPMPIRIDRILTNLPSLLVFPHESSVLTFQNKYYTFDYTQLYSYLLENLLRYTEKKYRTLFYKQLTYDIVEKWWNKTKNLQCSIHSFNEDLTYILNSYLKAYIKFLTKKNLRQALTSHIDEMINYLNQKVSENSIDLDYNKSRRKKHLYKKKGEYIYPDIIETDIFNSENGKIQRKAFVPMLMYDDLLECYLFNKKQIDPEGFEKLEDAKIPQQNTKKGLFSRKKDKEVDSTGNLSEMTINSTSNEIPEESTNKENNLDFDIIPFEKIIELGIIKESSNIEAKTLNPEKILEKIDIEKIFQEII